MSPYEAAADFFPAELRGVFLRAGEDARARGEELRLRAGSPPSVSLDGRERLLPHPPVSPEELSRTLERCARGSVYALADQLREGYLALPGGHRLGVTGRAILRDGEVTGFRELSSLSLRVARAIPGAAEGLLPAVLEGERVHSTLILSPPGRGKTTLLRELVRRLSESGVRVAVADERGELAGMRDGMPGFELGPCADVMTGCPKAEAVWRLVRCMAPRAVALDEITAPADLTAAREAAGCGVAVLATAHVRDAGDLSRRPLYRALMQSGLFTRRAELLPDRTLRVTDGEGRPL